jgi:hypothetical protein
MQTEGPAHFTGTDRLVGTWTRRRSGRVPRVPTLHELSVFCP